MKRVKWDYRSQRSHRHHKKTHRINQPGLTGLIETELITKEPAWDQLRHFAYMLVMLLGFLVGLLTVGRGDVSDPVTCFLDPFLLLGCLIREATLIREVVPSLTST